MGNIIGARVGYDKIPAYYKNDLELKDVKLELPDDLANGAPAEDDDSDLPLPKQWLEKYLHLKHSSTKA